MQSWHTPGTQKRGRIISVRPAEFYQPQAQNNAVPIILRYFFFEAIRKHAPYVLDELAEDVYPILLASPQNEGVNPLTGRRHRFVGGWPGVVSLLNRLKGFEHAKLSGFYDPKELQALDLFVSAMTQWGERHNLSCEWIYGDLIFTFSLWEFNPEGLKQRSISLDMDFSNRGEPLIIQLSGFDPRRETAAVYRKWARRELRAHADELIEHHIALARARASGEGLELIPRGSQPEHAEWLVLYQVCGLSFSKLEANLDVTRPTIVKRTRDMAALLGIKLRNPDKGGAPKGTRRYNL